MDTLSIICGGIEPVSDLLTGLDVIGDYAETDVIGYSNVSDSFQVS